ncbi:MAG: hypothetical protein Greene041619_948 [Candidatus Peregrinibacteria bacterium Greene0416_19]|nr:MAG: hypothetical protein Greene041619_948 [Candidatus Peregrinibacteria bacterium Greene0416_19]
MLTPQQTAVVRWAWTAVIFAALLGLSALLMAKKINFSNADIGRHLVNGRIFIESHTIPQTNLYSYTYPDFPTINHHWGSGVIFYLIGHVAGFTGLSAFFAAMSILTFALFFLAAWRESSFPLAVVSAAIALPLLSSRTEIRPEAFSYLLTGLFLLLLLEHRRGTMSLKMLLLILIPAELLWVNLHIYFFLGPFLIFIFLLEEILDSRKKRSIFNFQLSIVNSRPLLLTFALTSGATILNPAGIRGALEPLTIFREYGYRLAENQTVWFIDGYMDYPLNLYFKIVCLALVGSWMIAIIRAWQIRKVPSIAFALLSVTFSVLAWLAIRNFTLFGLVAIPIIAANLAMADWKRLVPTTFPLEVIVTPLLAAVMLWGLFTLRPNYWRGQWTVTGLGLRPGALSSLEFFRREGLRGPLFNNYDIGGYLTYGLYPQEKVFVDARPEAYPTSFFTDVLVPMQENEETWKKIDAQYRFNTIFFQRQDLTEWGQRFMIARVFDPAWAPVYVDGDTLILIRRDGPNQETIKKHELPQSMFRVRNG